MGELYRHTHIAAGNLQQGTGLLKNFFITFFKKPPRFHWNLQNYFNILLQLVKDKTNRKGELYEQNDYTLGQAV